MEKKKLVLIGIVVIALAALLGAGMFFSTHVFVGGGFFPKDAAELDLTGRDVSVKQYQQLCEQFPDAEIRWEVPFQGSRYPLDTTSITVTSLTEEEAESLTFLPNLKQVDGSQCPDIDALRHLQNILPDCFVLYMIDGVPSDAQQLTVKDADISKLEQLLPQLPNLQSLTLEGKTPQTEDLLKLQEIFPALELHVTLNIGGQAVSAGEKQIDLTGTSVTMQELSKIMPLLAGTEEIVLKDTPLTDAELKELMGEYPDIFFLCDLDFAGKTFSTDCTQIDLTGCPVTVEEVEELLPCFPRLTFLNLSHCGIDDEAMDALNLRWPDISIVWTLQIGRITVRTDDTVFFPSRKGEHNLPGAAELEKLRFCREMVAIDIGHSRATHCNWAANMPHLKYLILADTKVGDLSPLSNAKELIYLEVFSLPLTDYTPLLGCTALQDLNIGSTFADPAPLAQMDWLHNLFWHGILKDSVWAEDAQKLQELLPDTNVVLETPRLNIGGMWRYIPHYYVFRDFIDGNFFNQEYVWKYLEKEDSKKLLSCDHGNEVFAADVWAEFVRYRIDNKLPIPGIKNVGSEKAEVLYQSLLDVSECYFANR